MGRPVGRPVAVVGARPVAATEFCVGCTMIVEGSHDAVLTGAVVVALVGRLTGFEVCVSETGGAVSVALAPKVLFAVVVGRIRELAGPLDVG